MFRSRALVVGLIAAGASLAVPAQAGATPAIPKARDARVALAAAVNPGESAVRDVRPAWQVNLAGVSWNGSDPEARGVDVSMRALREDVWSEWTTLPVSADDAPDEPERRASARRVGAHRVFTDPQWLGHADRLQVRVSLSVDAAPVRGVRVHLMNTLGDPPRGPAAWMRAAARFLTQTAATPAEAKPSKPSIITRKGWGADESLRSEGPGLADTVKMAFIHHTVNSNSYSKSEAAGLVRGIYRYHTLGRGYSDIAYNFLVDRYGQIFEGRWGGMTNPVIGAHTLGFNTETTGVALIGTFTSSRPPSAMLTSLEKLLAWKLDVHHVPPKGTVTMTSGGNDKYPKGSKAGFNRISGHRDGTYTSCPGSETYKRLGTIRDAVNSIGRPKIYLPRISSTLLRPDNNGYNETVTVSATFSQTVSWTLSYVDGGGTLRRRFSGTASSVASTWNGMKSSGDPVPTGRYEWLLEATDSSGHTATPGTGVVYVINRHPAGTYLEDVQGAYRANGSIREMMSDIVAASWFPEIPPVRAAAGERTFYPVVTTASLRPGTLLQGPNGARYIWSDSTLRRFAYDPNANPPVDAFAALDYDPADVIEVEASFVSGLPIGAPVQETGVHPDGTVIKNFDTGEKWIIDAGARRAMSTLARRASYGASEVVHANETDMTLPLVPASYPVRDGALIEDPGGGKPWIVVEGQRRRFITYLLFERMGFTDDMLLPASDADLQELPAGSTYW